jgi:hypothetical protein
MRDTAAVYYATQLSRRGLPVAIQYVHALALQAQPARQGGAECTYVILLQDRLGRVSTLRSTADAAQALWRDERQRTASAGPPGLTTDD